MTAGAHRSTFWLMVRNAAARDKSPAGPQCQQHSPDVSTMRAAQAV